MNNDEIGEMLYMYIRKSGYDYESCKVLTDDFTGFDST